jgi:hypothetical protein
MTILPPIIVALTFGDFLLLPTHERGPKKYPKKKKDNPKREPQKQPKERTSKRLPVSESL